MPAKKTDFDNNSNCQFLRENFATYDDYLDSWMVKFPCGAGGTITEFPSGKENTYKLADCTFLDNAKGKQEVLYPAAHWAASIDLNAPKLGKGNWWFPSVAEMVEIMRDITYGTTFWETNPDIINRVISKLRSINNSRWTILDPNLNFKWTSSPLTYLVNHVFSYSGKGAFMYHISFFQAFGVMPITIYEF